MSPFGLALGMGLLRRKFDGGIPHPEAEVQIADSAQVSASSLEASAWLRFPGSVRLGCYPATQKAQ